MTACHTIGCSNAFSCIRSVQSFAVSVTSDEEWEDIDDAFLREQYDLDKAYADQEGYFTR